MPTFKSIAGQTWQHLSAGQGQWRIPVLASATAEGEVDARTVVLRYVFPQQREVIFFSDRRLNKVGQLQENPRVCLVVFDAQQDVQVRLYGRALREISKALLDQWWSSLPDEQRRVYQMESRVEDPDRKGREHFTAFRVRVDKFHCLRVGENMAWVFTWRGNVWDCESVLP